MKKKSSNLPAGASRILLFALVVLFAVILSIASGSGKVRTDNVRASGDAVQVLEAQRTEVERAASPLGVDVEYSFVLNDALPHDTHLAFYAIHQYVHIYLDGELVYTLEPSGDTSPQACGKHG